MLAYIPYMDPMGIKKNIMWFPPKHPHVFQIGLVVVLFTEGRPDPGVAPPWLLCLPPGSAAVDFVRLPRFSERFCVCDIIITNDIDGNMSNLMKLYNGYIWLIYMVSIHNIYQQYNE